jgi:DNA-binding IclR family transcriptional regulator
MKSISHAMKALLLISDARKPLGVTEIAKELKLHKSSVSRILATLGKGRFVERDPDTGRHSLGLGILSLAGAVLARYQLPSGARRDLEVLAEKTGETVTLSGWNGRQAVNLEQILGPGAITNFSPPGRINPAHCTATGKVFLAYADKATVDTILAEPLERHTRRTIVDPAILRRQLQDVRLRGFAVNDREFLDEVTVLAAPVFNAQGAVPYAIAVTMPSFRAKQNERVGKTKALLTTTRELSMRLGYREETRSVLAKAKG